MDTSNNSDIIITGISTTTPVINSVASTSRLQPYTTTATTARATRKRLSLQDTPVVELTRLQTTTNTNTATTANTASSSTNIPSTPITTLPPPLTPTTTRSSLRRITRSSAIRFLDFDALTTTAVTTNTPHTSTTTTTTAQPSTNTITPHLPVVTVAPMTQLMEDDSNDTFEYYSDNDNNRIQDWHVSRNSSSSRNSSRSSSRNSRRSRSSSLEQTPSAISSIITTATAENSTTTEEEEHRRTISEELAHVNNSTDELFSSLSQMPLTHRGRPRTAVVRRQENINTSTASGGTITRLDFNGSAAAAGTNRVVVPPTGLGGGAVVITRTGRPESSHRGPGNHNGPGGSGVNTTTTTTTITTVMNADNQAGTSRAAAAAAVAATTTTMTTTMSSGSGTFRFTYTGPPVSLNDNPCSATNTNLLLSGEATSGTFLASLALNIPSHVLSDRQNYLIVSYELMIDILFMSVMERREEFTITNMPACLYEYAVGRELYQYFMNNRTSVVNLAKACIACYSWPCIILGMISEAIEYLRHMTQLQLPSQFSAALDVARHIINVLLINTRIDMSDRCLKWHVQHLKVINRTLKIAKSGKVAYSSTWFKEAHLIVRCANSETLHQVPKKPTPQPHRHLPQCHQPLHDEQNIHAGSLMEIVYGDGWKSVMNSYYNKMEVERIAHYAHVYMGHYNEYDEMSRNLIRHATQLNQLVKVPPTAAAPPPFKSCPVCFSTDTTIGWRVLVPCGHIFCAICVERLFPCHCDCADYFCTCTTHNTCPVCRNMPECNCIAYI